MTAMDREGKQDYKKVREAGDRKHVFSREVHTNGSPGSNSQP